MTSAIREGLKTVFRMQGTHHSTRQEKTFFKVQTAALRGDISAQSLRESMDFIRFANAKKTAFTSEEKLRYFKAEKTILSVNLPINTTFSQLINEDPEFRHDYVNYFQRTLEKTGIVFEKNNSNKLLFRGIQTMPSTDFSKPSIQFNTLTTPIIASMNKRHHGSVGLVTPRINDPVIATSDEKERNELLWTKGAMSFSEDLHRAAVYAIGGFDGKIGRTDGYLYIFLPSHSISMQNHMYRDLTDLETQNARTSYEHVMELGRPDECIAAIPMSQDGTLGEIIWNPHASPQAISKVKDHLVGDNSLKDFVKESNLFTFSKTYKQSDNSVLQDFEAALPCTFEEHQARHSIKLDSLD